MDCGLRRNDEEILFLRYVDQIGTKTGAGTEHEKRQMLIDHFVAAYAGMAHAFFFAGITKNILKAGINFHETSKGFQETY